MVDLIVERWSLVAASGAFWVIAFGLIAIALIYANAGRGYWAVAGFGLLGGFTAYATDTPLAWKIAAWMLFAAPLVLLGVPIVRRTLFSAPLLRVLRHGLPAISATERAAMEAGSIWWDGEFFRGRPRWRRMASAPPPPLPGNERAFLDGPVEELCELVSEYRINHELGDLPSEAWRRLREDRYFGMLIPEEYGGLGFSTCGMAAVVTKLATRSVNTALTVLIPNSVGPAKLLLRYGTAKQKEHYLPRLASGELIPCFALTSLESGSDAGAMPDSGVVCYGRYNGQDGVLGIRLDFDKRYITLGPVATLIGVAFKLYDPERLLGDEEDLGITLALVPADAPGVESGARHRPLHMGFQNGPIRGRDVFVPLDTIIGGPRQAGNGWRMLMEALTDGRGISLPALSAGAAKLVSRITGAYARVRFQFGMPIGFFEGVQEPLARIAANTYAIEAARRVTLGALERGEQPAVISAIVKYHTTERARRVMQDAMDVHAGKAICLGPRNIIGEYHSMPTIGITVEGANILTRNLIVFGQGAMRCHPFLQRELAAAADPDRSAGEAEFDRLLAAHLRFAASNAMRALVLALTGGRPVRTPPRSRGLRRYYRQLSRMSAAFAFTTDVLLLRLRGDLKRRERMSARMADIVGELYLAAAALKYYRDQNAEAADLPLVRWVVEDSLFRMQSSFYELFANMRGRVLPLLLRWLLFPTGRTYRRPSDSLDSEVANILLVPSSTRDRLTAGVYQPQDSNDPLHRLEEAHARVIETKPLQRKLKDALRLNLIRGEAMPQWLASAVSEGVLTEQEAESLRAAEAARLAALRVDAFGQARAAEAVVVDGGLERG